MRISDWSSDVCSSDLVAQVQRARFGQAAVGIQAQGVQPHRCGVSFQRFEHPLRQSQATRVGGDPHALDLPFARTRHLQAAAADGAIKSEEHTSELQSLMRISYAVFCLKKKN